MFNLLKSMQFHLVTGFGKSSNSFDNTSDNITGQGVLQGSSNAQLWSDLLWILGGQLNLYKCYYYAFCSSINYKTNKISYSSISFEDGIKVKSCLDGTTHTLQALPPNEARCTFGVMLSPDGDCSTQLHATKKGEGIF
jgi:hypothetical protein